MRLFSALQAGGGGYVCMCAALAVDAGARREGEKISIGTWTTNSSQGCCRLEEEPGNVIKAACVDTCGSKRHECDIYWLFTTMTNTL